MTTKTADDWRTRNGRAAEPDMSEEIPPPFDEGEPDATTPPIYRAVEMVPRILAASTMPRVRTEFPKLNEKLGDLRLRTVTAIVSGVAAGKTALGLQMAAHHSQTAPAVYYGLELTPEQLAARVIAQRTGAVWREVLDGLVDEDRMREVLAPLNLYLMSRAPDPVDAIPRALDAVQAMGDGVPLLVIDYVQLLSDVLASRGDMRIATMMAVHAIHRLTETRDLVTIVISQSSRAGARQIRDASGEASELVGVGAETAAIEASAANQLVLSFAKKDDATEHEVTMNIPKARYGGAGKVGFTFHGPSGRWAEMDRPPLPESRQARREQIVTSLQAAGSRLSKNSIRERDGKVWVKGNKGDVNHEIDAMSEEGLLSNEGGAVWLQ